MEDLPYKLPPDSRALVTGATGFTGSLLVRKLLQQGVRVVVIARHTSNLDAFKDMEIEWIRGDVFDENLINQAIKGVNYIFHLVTPFREAKSPNIGYYNVHVLSTQLLAKAALKQPEFKRFVHVSTIGVHGNIKQPPADENAPLQPGDVYQETKLEAEIWLKNYAAQEELSVTIVRPAGIYGFGEKRLLKIFNWVYRQWVPVIGEGNNLLHFIHVDDLTNFLILAATHPKSDGEVFICGSPEAISFKKMVSIISDYYGNSVKFIKFPAAPLFALGYLFEVICRPLGIEPPIYRRRLAFYTKDRSFNTSKMNNLLGFVPAHSDEEGLKELAQWYVDQGWIK